MIATAYMITIMAEFDWVNDVFVQCRWRVHLTGVRLTFCVLANSVGRFRLWIGAPSMLRR